MIVKRPEDYDPDFMYDVVAAVLKLQGTTKLDGPNSDANYWHVHKELIKNGLTGPLDKTVAYLRYAEQKGYIKGNNSFYRKSSGSGGAKRWHFIKWPPYPYFIMSRGPRE